jgi:hypothetical protein
MEGAYRGDQTKDQQDSERAKLPGELDVVYQPIRSEEDLL